MTESLRALLHRHADELAEALAEAVAATPRAKAKETRARKRNIPLVAPEPIGTPEQRARAEVYVRRALGS